MSITYYIEQEGSDYVLYSSVPTDFGTKPAVNYVAQGSLEYCIELKEFLENQ